MSRFVRIEIDPEVVAALQRGERRAAEAVYRALSGAVFTLARRLVTDVQLAKEITQDTFVDVIERAATVTVPHAFVGWVRSVAVNHCLMRLRSPWHQRRRYVEEVDGGDAASDSARLDSLGDVERALAQLSDETRFVVWMHDVEGYTHAEIGKLTGNTASYSKSQLARGYAQLLAWSSEENDVEAKSRSRTGAIETPEGADAAALARLP